MGLFLRSVIVVIGISYLLADLVSVYLFDTSNLLMLLVFRKNVHKEVFLATAVFHHYKLQYSTFFIYLNVVCDASYTQRITLCVVNAIPYPVGENYEVLCSI